jgi:uncharacterized LabA/DUF88 family protein
MRNVKTAVFIDGSNLHTVVSRLNLRIDYQKLQKYLNANCDLLRTHYYTAERDVDKDSNTKMRKFFHMLKKTGYKLVTKPAKEYRDDAGVGYTKGNMDIEIVVDMFRLAPSVDQIVLFTGDNDFVAAVNELQYQGKRVVVISSAKTTPSVIGEDLRYQADEFIEIMSIPDITLNG